MDDAASPSAPGIAVSRAPPSGRHPPGDSSRAIAAASRRRDTASRYASCKRSGARLIGRDGFPVEKSLSCAAARAASTSRSAASTRAVRRAERNARRRKRGLRRARRFSPRRAAAVVGAAAGSRPGSPRPRTRRKTREEFEGGAGRDQLDGEEPPETRERRARGGNLLVRDRVGGRRRRHSLANPPREIIDAT